MAWISTLDSFDPKHLGADGSATIGSERNVYYNTFADLTEYDVAAVASTWNKIHHIEDYTATDKTNLIEVFDGAEQTESKSGKTTSELKVTQTFKGWINSIGKLKGKELWFAECLTDARAPINADGLPNFYEIRYVQGKLISIEEEKGDAEAVYKITGTGSYVVSSQRKVFKGITPTTVTLTADGTAVTTTPENVTVTGLDFTGASIDLTTLSDNALLGEITSISIEKVSGPSFTVGTGANDATKTLTYSSTGSSVVKAKIVTANGGIFYSAEVTIVVS